MILLDSSVLINLFRKKVKSNSFFFKLLKDETEFGISSVTHYEIGIGNKDSDNKYWVELNNNLVIFLFDKDCSIEATNIYLGLKKENKLIDLADILIGATAIANNLKLATLNIKHFSRIKDLELVSSEPHDYS